MTSGPGERSGRNGARVQTLLPMAQWELNFRAPRRGSPSRSASWSCWPMNSHAHQPRSHASVIACPNPTLTFLLQLYPPTTSVRR